MCIIFFQASNASSTWETMVTGVAKASRKKANQLNQKPGSSLDLHLKVLLCTHLSFLTNLLANTDFSEGVLICSLHNSTEETDWLTSSPGHLHLPPTLQIQLFFVRPLPHVFSSEDMEWIGLEIPSPGVCQDKVKP